MAFRIPFFARMTAFAKYPELARTADLPPAVITCPSADPDQWVVLLPRAPQSRTCDRQDAASDTVWASVSAS